MAKVVMGMTMSLDGFVEDEKGDVSRLYPDLGELRETEMLQDSMQSTGAVVMGRHAYDMAQDDFTGYEYQVPIFVLTHDVPEKAAKGQNSKLSFTFVTDGVASAVEKAKAAAGDRDVSVIGGAATVQQIIKAGLGDELQVGIMPVFLGSGLRLFERLGSDIQVEKVKSIDLPQGRTDLVFRFVK